MQKGKKKVILSQNLSTLCCAIFSESIKWLWFFLLVYEVTSWLNQLCTSHFQFPHKILFQIPKRILIRPKWNTQHTSKLHTLKIGQCILPIINATHIIPDVDVSLGFQQHSNNSTVTILSSYYQCSEPILYRVKWTGEHTMHTPTN